jgi:photosystem II stability/assembly factor-like uncharacterized protein
MNRRTSAGAIFFLVVSLGLSGFVPAQEPAEEHDADAARVPKKTKENILRWLPVPEKALHAPVPEFRALARKVAEGSGDARILRAYHRLYPRLFPFDSAPPKGMLEKALAAMQTLRARSLEKGAPPPAWSWYPLGPRNIPGRMTAIALHPTDPDTVFTAGADGGIWKTTDLGATWTPLGDAQPTLAMGALAVDPADPDILYAGTGEGNYAGDNLGGVGVMKSVDGGMSWTLSNRFAWAFHDILIDPRDRNRVWAATSDGLFVSSDAGASFQRVGGGLPARDTTTVLISSGNPDIMLAGIGTGFASWPESGLWRSTDGGQTWWPVPSFPAGDPVGRIALAQCRGAPSRIYAAIHSAATGGGLAVYRSFDEGGTWMQASMPGNPCNSYCWYCLVMAADPGDPGTVYLGGVDIYRTRDGGVSWRQINNQGPASYVHVDQHHLVAPAPGVIWSANDGGINLSRDYGDTWEYVGLRLETAQYYHLTTDPTDDTYATGGTQDQGTHRFGASTSWQVILGADGGYTAISWVDPRIWYATTQFLWLYRSRNRGAGMELVGNGIDDSDARAFIAPFILDRSNPNNLLAGTTHLWRSTDQGDNFTSVSPDFGSVISAIDNCRDQPDSIWVGTADGGVWHTTDGGGSWQNRTAGLPARSITSVSAHPSMPGICAVSVGGTGTGHIFFTSDSGQTWQDRSAGLPDIHFNQVLIIEDTPDVMVAAADLGVYRSDDAGLTWTVYGTGLPNVAVDSLSYASQTGTIRVGTHGRGAWQLVPPGACAIPPEFAGLRSAEPVLDGAACVVDLQWPPAASTCPQAPSVSYNIYRSQDPLFAPGAGSLLQAGLGSTAFRDLSVTPGRAYFYIVRAEDGQTVFRGPANGGKEDPNLEKKWATPGNPFSAGEFFDDGGDTTAWLEPDDGWSIQECGNSTPGGRYSYHSSRPDSEYYLPNTCAVLMTPEMVVTDAGSVLSYQASYNLEEGWDGVVVEISTDGGASWMPLPPDSGYPGALTETLGNACNLPRDEPAFTGPPGNGAATPFALFQSGLGAYMGQTVRIRWMLTTDPGLEFRGFDLDDVRITSVAAPAAPAMGNVLKARKESGEPRFLWEDVAGADGYKVYHSLLPDMTGQSVAGSAPTGSAGWLDSQPRPEPAHYYRLHAAVGCVSEGP